MKAVGEYVIVEQEVIFSEAKTIQEYDGYKFVPIAQVMAVIE
jgi:hypothetical protein